MRRTTVALACLSVLAATPAMMASAAGPSRESAVDGSRAAQVLPGFQARLSIGSVTEPTAVAFAADGTAFVALKTGQIKSFDYDRTNRVFEPNVTSTDFADLTRNVMNYWDRGLTGIAVDPQFGTAGNNYIYVNYTYNRDPRDSPPVVPKWGDPALEYDDCPSPASVDPPTVGCPAMARVTRLTAERRAGSQGWTMVPGSERELLAAGCFQFPSHASGDVRIGPDGWLYASFGDGASFTAEDWGQVGNPCGDPTNEGGSLRSQDARTSGDPLGVGGAIVRMDRATGLAPDGTASNASRLVAYGQRNPWRFSFRDGTSQLWSSDVGGSLAEEVNRITVASGMAAVNRGWPCYEGSWSGSARNPAWDGLDLPICEQLYAAGPAAVQPPAFSYSHDPAALPGPCQASTSATSGVAFAPATGNYPAGSKGAMFFGDFARGCLWRVGLTVGEPDPSKVTPFVTDAGTPVGLTAGPDGDLFYVDYGLDDEGTPTENAGAIRRVEYRPSNQAPVAVPVARNTSGPEAPITVTFDGTGSGDPDGDALTYAWDLDGDGAFDDGAGATQQRTYSSTTGVWVSLRVTAGGLVDQRSVFVRISPANAAPTIESMSPPGNALWSVGQRVAFAATATDDGGVPDSAYTWQVSIRHCPGGGTGCHTHPLQTHEGTRSGSFEAPDHEWVSTLILKVTVTDSAGLSATRTVELSPQPALVGFQTSPAGVPLTIAGTVRNAPHQQTFIEGSAFQVVAPEAPVLQDVRWLFSGWSDGGARSHTVVARGQTLIASYRPADPDQVRATLRVLTQRKGLEVRVDGRTRRAPFARAYSWGTTVKLVAPKRQVRDGTVYRFARWSDGKGRRHAVVLSGEPLTVRAVYRRQV